MQFDLLERLGRRAAAPVMACLLASALAAPALADDAASPAPERDKIATDRPDFVESSNVVGRGRLQIETSVEFARNKEDGVKERGFSTPTLLRVGVSDTLELRLESDGRQIARSEEQASGMHRTDKGYGDLSLGVKWHAIDERGARPSIGLLLHADLDTGSAPFRGNDVRPSLRLAAEWELPNDFSLGIMPGFAYEKDDDGQRYASAIMGVVVGKEWTEGLRSFVEVASPHIAHARHGGTEATLDLGLAYLLSDNLQVDSAVSRRLNQRTTDWNLTFGLSARF